MKYTAEKAAQIVMERSRKIRNRRKQGVLHVAAFSLFVLVAALVIGFSGTGSASQVSSVYGAFLLSADAGGYILTAVAAFAAGVLVTAIVQRQRRRKKPDLETN